MSQPPKRDKQAQAELAAMLRVDGIDLEEWRCRARPAPRPRHSAVGHGRHTWLTSRRESGL